MIRQHLISCSTRSRRLVTATFLALLAGVTQAQTEINLGSGNSGDGDQRGSAVDISGDRLIIGVPGNDFRGLNAGLAYMYTATVRRWDTSISLRNPDPKDGDYFGTSVALDGDLAAVGALGSSKGFVYLFKPYLGFRWRSFAKLSAIDSDAIDRFGASLAITPNRVVVGAPGDQDNGVNSGSVYVFQPVSGAWQQIAKLKPSDGKTSDTFGHALAMKGNRLLAGAPGVDLPGAIYVFEHIDENWQEIAKLTAGNGNPSNNFGVVAALDENVAVVGDNHDGQNGDMAGSVYVFELTDGVWQRSAKLTASDGEAGDKFGTSVAVKGNRIIVGAPGDDKKTKKKNKEHAGSVYIFDRVEDVWQQVGKISANTASPLDHFGAATSMDNDELLVGAPQTEATGPGTAYMYDLSTLPPNQAPDLSVVNAAILSNEGGKVRNSGTVSDPDKDKVELRVSAGKLNKTSKNNWRWRLNNVDGPTDSQTVLVSATDSKGGGRQLSFDLTVQNLAPTVEKMRVKPKGSNNVVLDARLKDESSKDTLSVVVDWGDGTREPGELKSFDQFSKVKSLHTYSTPGTYQVNLIVADEDGGTTAQQMNVEVK